MKFDKVLNIFTPPVVPMPSSQFEFKLCNTTVAQLDVKKSSVLGVNIGYTKVTLVDKSILCKTITINIIVSACIVFKTAI